MAVVAIANKMKMKMKNEKHHNQLLDLERNENEASFFGRISSTFSKTARLKTSILTSINMTKNEGKRSRMLHYSLCLVYIFGTRDALITK